jgi:hypothetical protein
MTSLSLPVYSGEPGLRVRKLRGSIRYQSSEQGPIMDNDNETIGGYDVPVDPMDMLQCESCQ